MWSQGEREDIDECPVWSDTDFIQVVVFLKGLVCCILINRKLDASYVFSGDKSIVSLCLHVSYNFNHIVAVLPHSRIVSPLNVTQVC